MGKVIPAALAERPQDFTRLGLTPDIQPWEDGVRTSGQRGEYEWWYFDAKLSDGSSLVIVFYTAPITATQAGFHPSLSFTLTRPDGTRLEDAAPVPLEQCSFGTERCQVRLGKSVFEGDLHSYRIHYENGPILADVELTGRIPAWRPATGHIFFGENKYFAWLPSVPEGAVTASITANGVTEQLTGTGYHDHNWGNVGMFWLMHHWYWGRAKIGDYQAITSYITARKKYGYAHFPIFLLAKNGEVLGDDGNLVTYTQSDPVFNPATHKHFHRNLSYEYRTGDTRYRVCYTQQEIVEEFSLADSANVTAAKAGAGMRLLLRLAGLDPSYVRMTGTAKVERFEGERLVETVEAPALWELMYFGTDAEV